MAITPAVSGTQSGAHVHAATKVSIGDPSIFGSSAGLSSDFQSLLAGLSSVVIQPLQTGTSALEQTASSTTRSDRSGPASSRTTSLTAQFLGGNQPTQEIERLLQDGVPLQSIIDRIADQVAAATQKALPANLSSASGQVESTLSRSLTNALSPPANAPPGSAAEEAVTLASRLQQWLTGIAGVAEEAGQQSDISGSVLDANSAKELPAQRTPTSNQSTFDAASLAQSLLASAAASLSPQASLAASAVQSQTPTQGPSQDSGTLGSSAQAGAVAVASSGGSAVDLLGRMLVRAASVDAQLNAPAVAENAASGAPTSSVSADSAALSQTPSALAARFAAALAEIVSAPAAASSGSNGSSWGGLSDNHDPSQQAGSARSDALTAALAGASPPPSATQTQVTNASAAPAPPVDPSAIVEQLVQGMTMRTLQSGTSEIRLHLVPDNLGAVSMKLTVQGSSVSASVIASSPEVRNVLMNSHQELARALGQSGLTLSGFSVDVSGGDTGRHDGASGFGRRYVIHEFPGSDASSDVAAESSVGPSIVSGASLGILNYLA